MALTKIPGELINIDDLDLTNVGTLHLDSIVSDASPSVITIGHEGSPFGRDSLVIKGNVLIGEDLGDAFNADSVLRIQRSNDRAFLHFKTDADQESAILFGDVDDDVECAIEYEPANKALTFSTGNNTEAVKIDQNQQVGIGTSSPTSPNSVNKFLHIHNADHSSLVMSDDSNTWEIVSNNSLSIRDGTDTRVSISNAGITQFNTGDGQSGIAEFHTNASTGNATSYISIRPQGSAKGYIGNGSSLLSGADATDFIVRSEANLVLNSGGNQESVRLDSAGHVRMPLQSSAMVQLSGDQSNLATTPTTITFDTERFDQNGDFNNTSSSPAYAFVAPITGRYLVCINLYMKNIDNAASYYQLYVQSSNRTYYSIFDPLGVGSSDPTYWDMTWSGVIDMDAGDDVYFRMNQSGGSAQTDLDQVSHASISLLH